MPENFDSFLRVSSNSVILVDKSLSIRLEACITPKMLEKMIDGINKSKNINIDVIKNRSTDTLPVKSLYILIYKIFKMLPNGGYRDEQILAEITKMAKDAIMIMDEKLAILSIIAVDHGT